MYKRYALFDPPYTLQIPFHLLRIENNKGRQNNEMDCGRLTGERELIA